MIFHTDETHVINSDTMLLPPVIRKLTHCSHSKLRTHAQEVQNWSRLTICSVFNFI